MKRRTPPFCGKQLRCFRKKRLTLKIIELTRKLATLEGKSAEQLARGCCRSSFEQEFALEEVTQFEDGQLALFNWNAILEMAWLSILLISVKFSDLCMLRTQAGAPYKL